LSLPPPIRLGVLISGGGTTLVNLARQIRDGRLRAEVVLVIASRECQGVERSRELGLRCEVVPRRSFTSSALFSERLFGLLREAQVELVALGGFLSRIEIPDDFARRVMNIHPALIPAFCGHGMHGQHVHEAVLARGCKVSGCTVHFCDNEYDHGPIILQRCVCVQDDDTPDTLAERIFAAECDAYPEAIQMFADGRLRIVENRVVIQPPSG
jgi:formyltetrahydrofolate-dependent phosphoribosylglycinamide formyltransferase